MANVILKDKYGQSITHEGVKVLQLNTDTGSTISYFSEEDFISLPAVTTDNNNKILKVIDGEWQLAEDEVGGSASSIDWENIQNKPFINETVVYFDVDIATTQQPPIVMNDVYCYKVSDDVLELEQIGDIKLYAIVNGATTSFGLSAMRTSVSDGILTAIHKMCDVAMGIVFEDHVDDSGNVVYPKGIYSVTFEPVTESTPRIYKGECTTVKELVDENISDDIGANWEKLINRPFGYTKVELLPESIYKFEPDNNYGGLYALHTSNAQELVAGEEYTVMWDGQEYTCTCINFDLGTVKGTGIGNGAIFGITANTGEPFILAYYLGSNGQTYYNSAFTTSTSSAHILNVYKNEVKKISPEFLPNSLGGGSTTTEQIQTDWSEKDETSPAFLKNKPFYQGETTSQEFITNTTHRLKSNQEIPYGILLESIWNMDLMILEMIIWKKL